MRNEQNYMNFGNVRKCEYVQDIDIRCKRFNSYGKAICTIHYQSHWSHLIGFSEIKLLTRSFKMTTSISVCYLQQEINTELQL